MNYLLTDDKAKAFVSFLLIGLLTYSFLLLAAPFDSIMSQSVYLGLKISVNTLIFSGLALLALGFKDSRLLSLWLLMFLAGYLASTTAILTSVTVGGRLADYPQQMAFVARFSETWKNVDGVYQGFSSSYPMLLQYTLGKLSSILGVYPNILLKHVSIIFIFLISVLAYVSWRKLLPRLACVLIVASYFLINSSYLTFIWHKGLSLFLIIPWWLYYIERLKGELSIKETLLGSVIGSILFLSYYYWFFAFIILFLVNNFLLAARLKSFSAWLKSTLISIQIPALMLLFTSVYWYPYISDMINFGGDNLALKWFNGQGVHTKHLFSMSLPGLALAAGLIYLFFNYVNSAIARVLFLLVVCTYLFNLIGQILLLNGTPIMHHRIDYLRNVALAAGFGLLIYHLIEKLKVKYARAEFVLPVVVVLAVFFSSAVDMSKVASKRIQSREYPVIESGSKEYKLLKGQVLLAKNLQLNEIGVSYGFIGRPYYSPPAANYRDRLKFLVMLSKVKNEKLFSWLLNYNKFDAVDRVWLPGWEMRLEDNNFPDVKKPRIKIKISFDKQMFFASSKKRSKEGIRSVNPVDFHIYESFTDEEKRFASLFVDQDLLKEFGYKPVELNPQVEDLYNKSPVDYLSWSKKLNSSLKRQIFPLTADATLKTFLLIGQSNMEGWADYDRVLPSVKKEIEQLSVNVLLTTRIDSSVKELSPSQLKGGRYQVTGGRFGPELTFGQQVTPIFPGEEILIIRHAFGGTSLYGAWNHKWTQKKAKYAKDFKDKTKHRLYRGMLEKITNMREFAKARGYRDIEILGIAWLQGESDARFKNSAQQYEKNLINFIASLRTDLGNNELPFVFFQVNSMQFKFIDLVRDAQINVDRLVPYTELILSSSDVSPKDFTKYDTTHYDTKGILKIGREVGRSMVNMLNK
jgi:hypothetical protein